MPYVQELLLETLVLLECVSQVEEMKSDRALLSERAKVVNEEAAAEIRRSTGVLPCHFVTG